MEITTLVFLAFVAVSCLIYYIVPKKCQWTVLLIASLVFFVSSSALLTLYMLFTSFVIYGGALAIQKHKDTFAQKKKELAKEERKLLKEQLKKKQKAILTASVIIVVAVLALTKYFNFLGGIINSISNLLVDNNLIPQFRILLPLGISYYTLMSVSYIVDVHRGVINAEKNPLRLLLFVCYFPHIAEGPFDRYKNLDEQFRTPHKFDYDVLRRGFILLLYGFFKKIVVADGLGLMVKDGFKNAESYSGTVVIISTILYTLQLYMDFSGCIDIISGVSELFDIKVAENFRQPFFSKSIDEFWRRWHISLGAWLKDYVFYPISLSEHFKKINKSVKKRIKSDYFSDFIPLAYALFFVWFCNGLWHGTTIKYVIYGLYYYVLMMLGRICEPIFDKVSKKIKLNRQGKVFGLLQIIRTFVVVNIGMLLFRSATLSEFSGLVKKAVTSFNLKEIMSVSQGNHRLLIVIFGLIIVFAVSILKERKIDIRSWLISNTFAVRWVVYLFLILTTLVTGIYGVEFGEAAAIYAQF